MKKVGSVQDEIYYVGNKVFGVKRVGSVNLGSWTWTYLEGDNQNMYFQTLEDISDIKDVDTVITANIKNAIYLSTQGANIYHGYVDKCTGQVHKKVRVVDSSYTDAAIFKTAMSGVMAYYELETPLVYELEDVELPARFKVNDWGTEEQLHAEGVNSAPAILSVLYGVNAVDVLRRMNSTHISVNTMKNILDALVGTGAIGSYTLEYNETSNEYDCTMTAPSEPEEEDTLNSNSEQGA